MSPPYIFKVDELRENPGIAPIANTEGHWKPSIIPEYNYTLPQGQGVSDLFWYCQGDRIRQLPRDSISEPIPFEEYKTYSVFYCEGYGFWVLNGDGTNPDQDTGEVWHPLRFEHGHANYSSYLTNAGQANALDWQRIDQSWTHMLLPTTYHGKITADTRYGGLVGELPIFLALAALSMKPKKLLQWLPWMFQQGQWHSHSLSHGREHKRGVVVTVYLCPPTWADGGSEDDLEDYELGTSEHGKYYN